LDIVNDNAFRAAIEDGMGSNTFRNLMTLSSIVLFNKYIASVEMEGIMGRNASMAKLKEIYNDSAYRPDFDYNSNQIQLFPN
jgi:hypothetical protein